jgi:hypothetical protein
MLHLKYAQAVARMGDADEARRAVLAAHEAHAQDYHDNLLDLGGDFAMSQATHHCLAGMALAEVRGAAERRRPGSWRRPLACTTPDPRETSNTGSVPRRSRIDLATIRLKAGALDAASAALGTVFELPPAQRVNDLTLRLRLVRAELAAPIFAGSAQARELGERIEDFAARPPPPTCTPCPAADRRVAMIVGV